MNTKKTLASDNYSGVHPEIMNALEEANRGHASSYGDDHITTKAIQVFRSHFSEDIQVYFVYNGTGANVLGLTAATQSFNSVICSELAHINVDESTAPEKFTGCKLIPVATTNGKIHPDQVAQHIIRVNDQHHPQPRVISISQATEYGTVYSIDEIKALSMLAHKNNMLLHMDGSRISNAAVSLDKPFREFTQEAGVDILSFGGTKNGLMFGEAVIVFNKEIGEYMPFLRKQSMQLHSKMRFISAQFLRLLEGDLWHRSATHSNQMAKLLERGLRSIPGVNITQHVDANAVFALLPPHVIKPLQEFFFFYIWNEHTHEVRLMCSFDTTEDEINGFVGKVRELCSKS